MDRMNQLKPGGGLSMSLASGRSRNVKNKLFTRRVPLYEKGKEHSMKWS